MNDKKGNSSSFHLSFCVTAIFVTIIIVATGIFVISFLTLNQNQSAIAQQQQLLRSQSSNQTISQAKQQQHPFVSKDISFDIDNVTVKSFCN